VKPVIVKPVDTWSNSILQTAMAVTEASSSEKLPQKAVTKPLLAGMGHDAASPQHLVKDDHIGASDDDHAATSSDWQA
jgi:hypothetical protein